MNLPRIYLIAILLLAFRVGANGQEPPKAVLVDEFDPRNGCETLEMRLGYFFAETSNDARSNAIVVIHQSDRVFDNILVYKKAINHARFRGFPAERYTVLLTRGTNDIKVSFWLAKNGQAPQIALSNIVLKLPDNVSRIQFAEDTLELVKIEGRETFIPSGNSSCLDWFNPSIFAELLRTNTEFDAEFIIKTKSKSGYQTLVSNLRGEFHEIGIPTERLRFVYGGRDKEIEGGGAKLASVTTSFVKRLTK
jgi:hypothetical protein